MQVLQDGSGDPGASGSGVHEDDLQYRVGVSDTLNCDWLISPITERNTVVEPMGF